jgi:hypothetical protein
MIRVGCLEKQLYISVLDRVSVFRLIVDWNSQELYMQRNLPAPHPPAASYYMGALAWQKK